VSSTTTVAIAGVGLYLPGYPSASSWAAGQFDGELPAPTGLAFDRRNKRRTRVFGRAIGDSAMEAIDAAGADRSLAPIVVGSSIGESSTLISLLEQMCRVQGPMSPADFTVSVHNAASGLLSISSNNRGFCTSMAADHNTTAVSLLEGIGLVLQRQEPVLVVCCDEAAPQFLIEQSECWDLLAGAVVLAPVASDLPCLAKLNVHLTGTADLAPAAASTAISMNPQIGMLDLINAVQAQRDGRVALDRGKGTGFVAELNFAQRD
jgi:hypothetical protein